jgi:hypothetical protein
MALAESLRHQSPGHTADHAAQPGGEAQGHGQGQAGQHRMGDQIGQKQAPLHQQQGAGQGTEGPDQQGQGQG